MLYNKGVLATVCFPIHEWATFVETFAWLCAWYTEYEFKIVYNSFAPEKSKLSFTTKVVLTVTQEYYRWRGVNLFDNLHTLLQEMQFDAQQLPVQAIQ